MPGGVMPAGDAAVGGETERLIDVEGDVNNAVAMETVAVDDQVPDGDVQHEEATENTTSPTTAHVDAEEGDGEAGHVEEDAAGEQETVTEGTCDAGERTGNDEVPEAETAATPRPQSLGGSTEEPPEECTVSQNPEPGTRLHLNVGVLHTDKICALSLSHATYALLLLLGCYGLFDERYRMMLLH